MPKHCVASSAFVQINPLSFVYCKKNHIQIKLEMFSTSPLMNKLLLSGFKQKWAASYSLKVKGMKPNV